MLASSKLLLVAIVVAALLFAAALVGCTPEADESDTGGDATSATGSTEDEAAEGGADTICDHPYFPVSDGVVLTYSQEAPGAATEMTQEFEVLSEDTFYVHQTVSGEGAVLTADGEWSCTDEGLVQTSKIALDVSVPGIEFSDLEFSGVTLPSAEEFVEGARWQSTYSAAGTAEVSEVAVAYDVEIVQDNTLMRFEEVTVPAGTYEAARVESTETLSLTANGTALPETVGRTTTWYAEGVGIVKIQTEMEGGLFTQELLSAE
jgi:hypothetical protein